MIPRHALVLAAPESVEIASVQRAQNIGHIVAPIVDRVRDGMRLVGHRDRQLHRRHDEALIHKNLGPLRMIHRHQFQPVVVIRFP